MHQAVPAQRAHVVPISFLNLKETLHPCVVYKAAAYTINLWQICRAYARAHEKVGELYRQPEERARAATQNIAHSGKFSSDRTIAQDAANIWRVKPVRWRSAAPRCCAPHMPR